MGFMKNILITGGNGYIARSLKHYLNDTHNITTITRNDFDLTDGKSTREWFADKHFDVVVHTAITGGSRLKHDDVSVLDNNLKMYYNLLENKDHYNRFINIGSGAELSLTKTHYGMSKYVIQNSLYQKDNFYNVRVYAVFDENELDTRFIKSNIIRYLNKEPMVVHMDKMMDFFYMKDFVKVINHYIINDNLPKTTDCTYKESHSLIQIAGMINRSGEHRVPITLNHKENENMHYCGIYKDLGIDYIGLEIGIHNVYKELLCRI
jgi:GDP-L-fucose synthase